MSIYCDTGSMITLINRTFFLKHLLNIKILHGIPILIKGIKNRVTSSKFMNLTIYLPACKELKRILALITCEAYITDCLKLNMLLGVNTLALYSILLDFLKYILTLLYYSNILLPFTVIAKVDYYRNPCKVFI